MSWQGAAIGGKDGGFIGVVCAADEIDMADEPVGGVRDADESRHSCSRGQPPDALAASSAPIIAPLR